jgi:hypothetical protein
MTTKRNQTRMLPQMEKWLKNVQNLVSSASTAGNPKVNGGTDAADKTVWFKHGSTLAERIAYRH